MKNILRKGLRLIFLTVFVISTVLLAGQLLDKRSGSEAYEEALTVALTQRPEVPPAVSIPASTQPEHTGPVWIPEPVEDDPQIQEMEKIDLSALREINSDVIGWIRIPDTKVDYPVLQGQDNQFYLKHTWQKEENSVGSVFLESRNKPDFSDYNTIVYAHNMNDGSMFATLSKYTDRQYRNKHPYIYILTDAGVRRYEIFSMYQAHVDDPTYGLSFNQPETKAAFMQHALGKSRYDMDLIPEPEDRILTLSTCSSGGYYKRWVVQARLKMIQIQK